MRHPLALVAIVTVGCLCLACGDAPELVDTTPPALEETSPAASDASVPVSAEIQFRFDEPIEDGYQVSFVLDGTALAVDSHLEESGRVLVIEPPTVGAVPATAVVTLTGVRDRFGNPMDPQPALEWTYADWIPLGAQQTTAGTYLLAAGGDGPALAWLDAASNVLVRRWTGGGWGAPASPGAGTDLSLAMDPADGLAVAFYVGGRPYVWRLSGGAWTEVGSALPSQNAPRLGTALGYENGTLHVAFGGQLHQPCTNSPSCPAPNPAWMRLYRLAGASWELRSTVTLPDPWYSPPSASPVRGVTGDGAGVLVGWDSTVRRLADTAANGSSFTSFGSPGVLSAVDVFEGNPIVVAGGVVRAYQNGSWSNLGLTADVVSLDVAEGHLPVIATRTGAGTSVTVRFLRWNGADQWTQLGRTLTGTDAELRAPAVAVGPTGQVYRAINGAVARLNEAEAP